MESRLRLLTIFPSKNFFLTVSIFALEKKGTQWNGSDNLTETLRQASTQMQLSFCLSYFFARRFTNAHDSYNFKATCIGIVQYVIQTCRQGGVGNEEVLYLNPGRGGFAYKRDGAARGLA